MTRAMRAASGPITGGARGARESEVPQGAGQRLRLGGDTLPRGGGHRPRRPRGGCAGRAPAPPAILLAVERKAVLWRGLTALAALMVAAWLALGLRATVLTDRGVRQISNSLNANPSPEDVRRLSQAKLDLDHAAWFNPDREPGIYYTQVLFLLGERDRARKRIERLTREAPDDLVVWRTARGFALSVGDRKFEAEADRQLRELHPPR